MRPGRAGTAGSKLRRREGGNRRRVRFNRVLTTTVLLNRYFGFWPRATGTRRLREYIWPRNRHVKVTVITAHTNFFTERAIKLVNGGKR